MLTDEQISEIESASEFYIDECEHTISELCADWRALQAQVAKLTARNNQLELAVLEECTSCEATLEVVSLQAQVAKLTARNDDLLTLTKELTNQLAAARKALAEIAEKPVNRKLSDETMQQLDAALQARKD